MYFPTRGRRLRSMLILCGVAVFVWSSPEDQHILPAVLLGTAAALLSVGWYGLSPRWFGGKTLTPAQSILTLALLGATSGLSASVWTALLMLFKNFRHAHIYPDYPLGMIGAILSRAPVWSLAGMLIGIGVVLMVMVSRTCRCTSLR